MNAEKAYCRPSQADRDARRTPRAACPGSSASRSSRSSASGSRPRARRARERGATSAAAAAPGVELRAIADGERAPAPPGACADPGAWLAPLGGLPAPPPLAALGGAREQRALLWGTYRPSVYFGVRSRTAADAVVAGLMWERARGAAAEGRGGGGAGARAVRHECREGDGVEKFGWNKHDGRAFGRQRVVDATHALALETSFVKPRALLGPAAGGGAGAADGVHWASRVRVDDAAPKKGEKGDAKAAAAAAARAEPAVAWFYLAVDCDADPADAAACAEAAGAAIDGAAAPDGGERGVARVRGRAAAERLSSRRARRRRRRARASGDEAEARISPSSPAAGARVRRRRRRRRRARGLVRRDGGRRGRGPRRAPARRRARALGRGRRRQPPRARARARAAAVHARRDAARRGGRARGRGARARRRGGGVGAHLGRARGGEAAFDARFASTYGLDARALVAAVRADADGAGVSEKRARARSRARRSTRCASR